MTELRERSYALQPDVSLYLLPPAHVGLFFILIPYGLFSLRADLTWCPRFLPIVSLPQALSRALLAAQECLGANGARDTIFLASAMGTINLIFND